MIYPPQPKCLNSLVTIIFMVGKVELTQKDHFFYLSIYENPDNKPDEDPKFLMPFPYNNHNKDEMLEKASFMSASQ